MSAHNSVTTNTCELQSQQRSYRLEVVELDHGDRFWAISGSKKGGRHSGGGIPIANKQTLDGICRLLDMIQTIDAHAGDEEAKVASFFYRNRMFCAETRQFSGHWFYRLKAYANYFVRNGEPHFFANHALKPCGRGFYIQEFDFPLNLDGTSEAVEFSKRLRETIYAHLETLIESKPNDIRQLLRDDRVIMERELPWLNTEATDSACILQKPLSDILVDRLREEPLTPNELSIELGLTPQVVESHVYPSARYNPGLLSQGLLLDRVRTGFDAWNYLITQIPTDALDESPALIPLFFETPVGNWDAWKKATFSNDEYSTGRAQSIHFAGHEIDALEGGIDWGIIPNIAQLRAVAIRLFDLTRHYKGDEHKEDFIKSLTQRFVPVAQVVEND